MIPKKLSDTYVYKINVDLNFIKDLKKIKLKTSSDPQYYLNILSIENDNSYLYLTQKEYNFAMQGLLNTEHVFNTGTLSAYPDNNKDYIQLASELAFPKEWFEIKKFKYEEEYDFSEVQNHFFMQCNSMTELNKIVNLAESKGYKLIQFTFDTLYLEMKITKKGF